MHYPIKVGKLTITFLQSHHETQGAADLFELIVPPHAHLNLAHLHRESDETVFAMNGITTWLVDQRRLTLHPGEQLHIPRGTIHSYLNDQQTPARVICFLTPGLIGPEYFLELSRVFRTDDPPDLPEIGSIMARYDVIPSGVPTPPPQDRSALLLTLP